MNKPSFASIMLGALLGFGCSSGAVTTGGSGGAIESGGQAGAAGGAAGGITSAGTGGATTASGGTEAAAGGSTTGAGGRTTTGTGTGGNSGAGGTATSMGGTGGAGTSMGGTGGAGTSMGGGGAGACVPNMACKLAAPPTTGDIRQDCVDRINQFLTQCACLPALARATEGEACADQMAEYDAGKNSAHAGFIANICKPSGSQNECPGYSSNGQVIGLCMQQMWDEGPPPAGACTGDCYEQHGHYINMTDKSVHRVACGFFTTAKGDVWAAQNFF